MLGIALLFSDQPRGTQRRHLNTHPQKSMAMLGKIIRVREAIMLNIRARRICRVRPPVIAFREIVVLAALRRLVRQDLLDQIVWAEVIRLLEDPTLIQQELDRRLAAARSCDPTQKREQSLERELTHVGKGIERLLNAYQEGLLSIEQLRERMPTLRQRQQRLRAELQAIADQTNDRAAFLRLAETLTVFLTRLRSAAQTLSVIERQKIVRLLIKDILVGEDTITIRHSIPIPSGAPKNGGWESPDSQNYLLCKGRDNSALWGPFRCFMKDVFIHIPGFQPLLENGSIH